MPRRGRIDDARRLLLTAIEKPYYQRNTNHLIACLGSLCAIELAAGSGETAAGLAERTLVLAQRTRDRFQLPAALASVGTAALLVGDLDHAEDHLAQADTREREVRPGTPSSFFLEELRIARAAGSVPPARRSRGELPARSH